MLNTINQTEERVHGKNIHDTCKVMYCWLLIRWHSCILRTRIRSTITFQIRGRRGRNRMVVEFTTTYAIGAYHHWCCGFEPRSWQGVLDITLCCKVCRWLSTGRWFSPGNPVSSTNKTAHHDIAEILFKVALNTINQTILIRTDTEVRAQYGSRDDNQANMEMPMY